MLQNKHSTVNERIEITVQTKPDTVDSLSNNGTLVDLSMAPASRTVAFSPLAVGG